MAGTVSSKQGDSEANEPIYEVVVNSDEEYSIWPGALGDPPRGWQLVSVRGVKGYCLDYIDEKWTDRRPSSLRRGAGASVDVAVRAEPLAVPQGAGGLVDVLTDVRHPITGTVPPTFTTERLRMALGTGFLHLCLRGSHGSTTVALKLDRSACDFDASVGERGERVHRLQGTCELDGALLRCVVEIDATTMSGVARVHQADRFSPSVSS